MHLKNHTSSSPRAALISSSVRSGTSIALASGVSLFNCAKIASFSGREITCSKVYKEDAKTENELGIFLKFTWLASGASSSMKAGTVGRLTTLCNFAMLVYDMKS